MFKLFMSSCHMKIDKKKSRAVCGKRENFFKSLPFHLFLPLSLYPLNIAHLLRISRWNVIETQMLVVDLKTCLHFDLNVMKWIRFVSFRWTNQNALNAFINRQTHLFSQEINPHFHMQVCGICMRPANPSTDKLTETNDAAHFQFSSE